MRTAYLRANHSINGRSSLRGRLLAEHLRGEGELVLRHFVDEEGQADDDLLTSEELLAGQFDLVYVEGGLRLGLAIDDLRWKVPRDVAEHYLREGGVLIVADVSQNEVESGAKFYEAAAPFLGAQPDVRGTPPSAVYGIDEASYVHSYRTPLCRPDRMFISPWLAPALEGIDGIAAGAPVVLDGTSSIAASGNRDTSGTLRLDRWTQKAWPFPFARVRQLGRGYLVLISADVSHDAIVKECPDNARWISNLTRLLHDEIQREETLLAGTVTARRKLALEEDEWARALGEVASRRGILERRLRRLVADRMAKEGEKRSDTGWAHQRLLAAVHVERRPQLSEAGLELNDQLNLLFWPELTQLIRRDWTLFEDVFHDRARFTEAAAEVNRRYDAHAKDFDAADLALHRRAMEFLEQQVTSVEPS